MKEEVSRMLFSFLAQETEWIVELFIETGNSGGIPHTCEILQYLSFSDLFQLA